MIPITEFEARLKELDPKFEIVQHPNNPELAGVYYDRNIPNKTGFVTTVPSGSISEEYDPKHRDSSGHPHNWASKVTYQCQEHLTRLSTDPEYKELFYEKLPE